MGVGAAYDDDVYDWPEVSTTGLSTSAGALAFGALASRRDSMIAARRSGSFSSSSAERNGQHGVVPKSANLNTTMVQAVKEYSQIDCSDRSPLLPPLLPRIAESPFAVLHQLACALIGGELGNDDASFPH